MEFVYKAKTKNGEPKSGSINARSEDLALQILQSYGLVVLDIKRKKEVSFLDKIFQKKHTIKGRELAVLLRQLATMLSAKVPLLESFRAILNQSRTPGTRDLLFSLISSIDGGLTLSQAMASTNIFSRFYVEMVRSGEVSGRLEQVFGYLADYAENEHELESKARSAIIYPIFILIVFLVVGSVITVSIAPQMVDIFQEFERTPPFLTQLLISAGRFLVN
jgi:type II secretory pathway component PulF